jgi:hypothetical protein
MTPTLDCDPVTGKPEPGRADLASRRHCALHRL